MDGTARRISGKVEFHLSSDEDYSKVDLFEVYQHTSKRFSSVAELGPKVASFKMPSSGFDVNTRFSMFLGTFDNTLGSEHADPKTSVKLDSDDKHFDYLIIISRTAVNAGSPDDGYVPSDSGVAIRVQDRIGKHCTDFKFLSFVRCLFLTLCQIHSHIVGF
jgi:hypothetical protein